MRTESKRPRLTIDTNNVLRAILTPGNASHRLMTAWQQGQFQWILTQPTFEELTLVLNRDRFRVKYGFQTETITQLLATIAEAAEFVTPLPLAALPVHSRDIKDDILLACAFGGDCDYLVSEDEDLLVLASDSALGRLKIVNAHALLATLSQEMP